MDAETLKAKLLDAEVRCDQWLAAGNLASERGDAQKAQKCYDKSQFWLDRANALRDRLYAVE